jgi:hypothetical protein
VENHERKGVHSSRRELSTARFVDLAVFFTECLDCPTDFRSLSADTPDDCGHPSVSTNVFQVAELGGCPHQLVLRGKSRLWCIFSCKLYPSSEKTRKWLEPLVGNASWSIFRYYPGNYLKGLRKMKSAAIFADNAPIFEAFTQVCNTSAAGYRWSFANLPICYHGLVNFQSTVALYCNKGTNMGCKPLDLNTQVGVTSYFLWNDLDTYHAMLEHKIYVHTIGSKLTCPKWHFGDSAEMLKSSWGGELRSYVKWRPSRLVDG